MGRVHIYIKMYYSRSSDAPRSPSLARHPLCAGHREGLLCGKGVEPPRGRGRPSGARESQLFFGDIITNMFSKIHLDITSTTPYYRGALCNLRKDKDCWFVLHINSSLQCSPWCRKMRKIMKKSKYRVGKHDGFHVPILHTVYCTRDEGARKIK